MKAAASRNLLNVSGNAPGTIRKGYWQTGYTGDVRTGGTARNVASGCPGQNSEGQGRLPKRTKNRSTGIIQTGSKWNVRSAWAGIDTGWALS